MNRTKSGRALTWKIPTEHKLSVDRAVYSLPASIDLRSKDTPIFDQGQEGSCTANAGLGAFEYLLKNIKAQIFLGARNFLYYAERLAEGDPTQDGGASMHTCASVLNRTGCCPEIMWPYDQQDLFVDPPASVFAEAFQHRTIGFKELIGIKQAKACLASGSPFIFGIVVYSSFETAPGGQIPLPQSGEAIEGGHALCCVGYDDASQHFIVRNSWGTGWGNKGYCYLPYAYMASPSLADEFYRLLV